VRPNVRRNRQLALKNMLIDFQQVATIIPRSSIAPSPPLHPSVKNQVKTFQLEFNISSCNTMK
jgi:hypothetical protein